MITGSFLARVVMTTTEEVELLRERVAEFHRELFDHTMLAESTTNYVVM